MSSVSSIEADGISNACSTNVIMNSPVTSTSASEARNSTVVSRGFSSTMTSSFFFFFATFRIRFRGFFLSSSSLANQPESTLPARYLEHVSYRVGKVIKSITHAWRSGKIVVQIARRPVNQKRASNDIFTRHESPVPAFLVVIAIVTENKIVALGNNQLVVFHQFRHFFPPFRIHFEDGRTSLRKTVDIDALVDEAQAISRQGHHTLHEVLRGIHRIMEDDDVTAPDLAIGHQTIPPRAAAVAKLIHQQVVADQQRLLH